MLLTARDVARVMNISEDTVARWTTEQGLPAVRVGGQHRFNRTELLEWATIRQLAINPEIFHLGDSEATSEISLHAALEAGGIRHDVDGANAREIAEAIVARLDLKDQAARNEMQSLLESRLTSRSLVVSNGIRLPHPRYPVVAPCQVSRLWLFFLRQPMPLTAAQGSVDTLFLLVCPAVRWHLALLARLTGALREGAFLDAIKRRASAAEILACAKRFNGG